MRLLRLVLAAAVLAQTPSLPRAGPVPFPAVVDWLADGDTVSARRPDGTRRLVRLYGVDCPESAQPFGPEAAALTRRLAFRRTVTVRPRDVDSYGRTVAVVVLADGRELNRELVRAGLAWWYRRYAQDEAGDYGALEKEARLARRGLWRQDDPEPPWRWRRRRGEAAAY